MFSKKLKSAIILSTFAVGVAANGVVSANTDITSPELEVISNEPSNENLDVAFGDVAATSAFSDGEDIDSDVKEGLENNNVENKPESPGNEAVDKQNDKKSRAATDISNKKLAVGLALGGTALAGSAAGGVAYYEFKNTGKDIPVGPVIDPTKKGTKSNGIAEWYKKPSS